LDERNSIWPVIKSASLISTGSLLEQLEDVKQGGNWLNQIHKESGELK